MAVPRFESHAHSILDIYSVSGEEKTIVDVVYEALSAYPHLHLTRDGDAMIARTEFGPRNGGERTRILLAGHLDTVPLPTAAGSLRNRTRTHC